MLLGSTFIVPAEPSLVFERFLDPATMRACIPGCAEFERPDEHHFRGRLVNEIAHVRFDAAFTAEVTTLDPPRQVVVTLRGEDLRLSSSLNIEATLNVEPDGEGSRVTYAMDMAMWGRLGRLGESIFRRRTADVEAQFLASFEKACRGELDLEAAAVAQAGAASSGGSRISFARTGDSPGPRLADRAKVYAKAARAAARTFGQEFPSVVRSCRESWKAARSS